MNWDRKVLTNNKQLGGSRRRHGADTHEINRKIETFRKYRYRLDHLLNGLSFIVLGFKDPNKLCERLNLLVAAKQAGNNNAGNNNKRLNQ